MENHRFSIQRIWTERKPEIFCGLICFVSVAALISILIHRYLYVKSSYAILQAYSIPLTSQVKGEITQVFVNENQSVKKGQLLCIIDERPYLNQAEDAEGRKNALLPRIQSAEKDLERARFLIKRGAIAPTQLDSALATTESLHAQLRSAEAQLLIANSNVSRTRITAPNDGIIAFRSAQAGMFATSTVPLFGFIANQDRWVEAKIKETDLSGIQVGDHADVQFDALPGKKFSGQIESFGQSTESQFSAVPDDFSAGNFSKYAQWLPVRIKVNLDPNEVLPIGINSVVQMKRRRG